MSDVLRETVRIPCTFHAHSMHIPYTWNALCTPEMEWTRVIAKVAILADSMSTALTEDFNPITWWPTAPYPSLR
jgi:hypothetical protein